METFYIDHLHKIFQVSPAAERIILSKNLLSTVDRFVFGGVEKVKKNSLAMIYLLPSLEAVPDLEFSLGILVRSLMMDELLVMAIVSEKIKLKDLGQEHEDIKAAVNRLCYSFLADGIKYLIDSINDSQTTSADEKHEMINKYISFFPEALSISNRNKAKVNPSYEVSLKYIHQGLDQ